MDQNEFLKNHHNRESAADTAAPEDENEVFTLSEYGCLRVVCEDYGIDVSHITPKMGEHFFDDLMQLLCKCGHVGRVE